MGLKQTSIPMLTACIAASLSVGIPLAWSGAPEQAMPSEYRPRQSISYVLGSKFISGYFIHRTGRCHVTLMVIEKSDPDSALPVTAARVRLILNPGQVAGLDSEENRSLNITCGESGDTLYANIGDREAMTVLQASAKFGQNCN